MRVIVNNNLFDSALKSLKKKCMREGIIKKVRLLSSYHKKKKRK